MSLATVALLKAHLRIQHAAEDTILATYLAAALARIEKFIGRPITARTLTFTDPAFTAIVYGAVTRLSLPAWPIDPDDDDFSVTDRNGTEVPTDDYTVDAKRGFLLAKAGVSFGNGPYTIVAPVGLSVGESYAIDEAIVNSAVLDLVAEDYYHRNAGVRSESAAGGLSRGYAADDLPPKTKAKLQALRICYP